MEFYQVDVFTNELFGGNPLAVFPEAGKLHDNQMLKIAREMNLSETTFVFPPKSPDQDYFVRIYTPQREIPFGGHPMIGTAYILTLADKLNNKNSIRLGTKVGTIEIKLKKGNYSMKQPLPSFQTCPHSIKQLTEALSLEINDFDDKWNPEIVSTGFPAIFLPLKAPKLLAKIKQNLTILEDILSDVDMIYAFSPGEINSHATIHSRSFAPFIGIHEDPATGSAGGALGAYLVKNQVISKEYYEKILIKQGFEMGRPSTLSVKIGNEGEKITSVEVGGNSVLVLKGQMNI